MKTTEKRELTEYERKPHPKYYTQDRETGTIIDEFSTLQDAEKAVKEYEQEDKENGCFEQDFYEIKEIESGNEYESQRPRDIFDYDANYEQLIKNELHNLYDLEGKVPYAKRPEIHSAISTLEGILYSNRVAEDISRS